MKRWLPLLVCVAALIVAFGLAYLLSAVLVSMLPPGAFH
jgi:hypothetical protein